MTEDDTDWGEAARGPVFRLCYVERPWAWFTTQDVTRQWGDDWNR